MKHLTGVILTVLGVGFPSLVVQAVDFDGCSVCHGDILTKFWSRQFLHSPFAEKECEDCHAADEADAASVTDSAGPDQQKIEQLAESAKADTNHGFLLPGEKVGSTLIIDIQGNDGKISHQEIDVPPLAALSEVKDSGLPPVISEVRLIRVKQGGFVSATVGWQTDVLTDSQVRYGITDLTQKSEPVASLCRVHQVVLHGLKRQQIYRFSVVSTDLFGRSQTSAPVEFSTSNPYLAPPPPADAGNGPPDSEEAGMVSSFQRLGNDYLLELTLTQPAWVFINSSGVEREAKENRGLPDDEFHAELSSMLTTSIGACLGCHSKHAHPVYVNPKEGMTVLPEYPTLPNGRITCSSCHEPHSSNYYYLTRKDYQHRLCVGCHLDLKDDKKTN